MLNIKVISDTHGNLPDLGEVELLIIAGDICPTTDHSRQFQKAWVNRCFIPWVNDLKFKNVYSQVILVPGNHDFVFEGLNDSQIDEMEYDTNYRLKILINEEYDYEYMGEEGLDTVKMFGTPFCKIFGNWAFMREDERLESYYSLMPDDADIIISHDAPDLNDLGYIFDGVSWGRQNAGNKVLAKALLEKKPRYFFCGHIHSGNHNFEEYEGIKMANVAYVDELYQPRWSFLEFEYEKK